MTGVAEAHFAAGLSKGEVEDRNIFKPCLKLKIKQAEAQMTTQQRRHDWFPCTPLRTFLF